MAKDAGGMTFWMTFVALAVARVMGALVSPIPDCDETFNYWEPLHYLLYGRGFQTWEYGPQYAFRSYAYLLLHGAIGAPLVVVGAPKIVVFYTIRVGIALFCALCEAYFVLGVARRFPARNVGFLTLVFLASSAGMFFAGPAFLPSSFSMYFVMLCLGAWLRGQFELAVAGGAVGVLMGWPFCALIFVPLGLHMVLAAPFRLHRVAAAGIAASAIVLGASVAVDYFFLGRPVVAIWNIVKYNALGMGGGGQGSDLYGTEPWHYFLQNLTLNFNAAFAAFLASPLAVLISACVRMQPAKKADAKPSTRPLPAMPHAWVPDTWFVWSLVALLPAWAWLALMSSRAHKEERFMFPIFPLLALGAALTAATGEVVVDRLLCGRPDDQSDEEEPVTTGGRTHPRVPRHMGLGRAMVSSLAVIAALSSASRSVAYVSSYNAPNDIWARLSALVENPNGAGQGTGPLGMGGAAGAWRLVAAERARRKAAGFVAPFEGPKGRGGVASGGRWHGPHSNETFGLRVCVGKEWHRFPASFFLPDLTIGGSTPAFTSVDNHATAGGPLQLSFVRSGFGGQLPQPFDAAGAGTAGERGGFNDVNAEEPDRYVDAGDCDFIVDLALASGAGGVLEPWFRGWAKFDLHPRGTGDPKEHNPRGAGSKMRARLTGGNDDWVSVAAVPFLDKDLSPALTRAFFLPWLSARENRYGTYHILARRTAGKARAAEKGGNE